MTNIPFNMVKAKGDDVLAGGMMGHFKWQEPVVIVSCSPDGRLSPLLYMGRPEQYKPPWGHKELVRKSHWFLNYSSP